MSTLKPRTLVPPPGDVHPPFIRVAGAETPGGDPVSRRNRRQPAATAIAVGVTSSSALDVTDPVVRSTACTLFAAGSVT